MCTTWCAKKNIFQKGTSMKNLEFSHDHYLVTKPICPLPQWLYIDMIKQRKPFWHTSLLLADLQTMALGWPWQGRCHTAGAQPGAQGRCEQPFTSSPFLPSGGTFPHDDGSKQEIKNSLFVGESGNLGTETMDNEIWGPGGLDHRGRTLPIGP